MIVPKVKTPAERSDVKTAMDNINTQKVVDELAAIGFASATDFYCLQEGQLTLKSTESMSPQARAAIASLENTTHGVRLKLYDKMKALELLGKYLGLFDGSQAPTGEENNLLEAILESTGKELSTCEIPELQQTADACDDLVESEEAAEA